MQPVPPIALKPKRHVVIARQLDEVRAAERARWALTRGRDCRVASLTPTIVGSCASRASVSARDVGHRARGHVVDDDRQVAGLGQRGEMGDKPVLARPVVIRQHAQAPRRRRAPWPPSCSGSRSRCRSSRSRRSPARGPPPARRRPRRRDNVRRTAASPIHRWCRTAPARGCPRAICHSTKSRNAASSNASSRNGVTRAGIDPRNMLASFTSARRSDIERRARGTVCSST